MTKSEFSGKRRGLIIAADVTSLDQLQQLSVLSSKCDFVAAIKIGFQLALRFGLPRVSEVIREAGELPIIYDHQKAGTDIPSMGSPFAKICSEARVSAAIIFPLAGPLTLEGFVKGALDCGVEPIVGLAMTHRSFLASEHGFIRDDAPSLICKSALDLGVTSFVLPATKTKIIESFASQALSQVSGAKVLMPGVGSQGGTLKDAVEATHGLRAFPIIGSAIYGASDPAQALYNFGKELEDCA